MMIPPIQSLSSQEELQNWKQDEQSASTVQKQQALKRKFNEILSTNSPFNIRTEFDFIQLAKEKRNVEIRLPKPSDFEDIVSNLYSGILGTHAILNDTDLKFLIAKQGKMVKNNQEHRLFVLQELKKEELVGTIHFYIQKKAQQVHRLVIHSLDILPAHQCQSYGSLLLSFALYQGQYEGCTQAQLKTTAEGVFLYGAYDFRPTFTGEMPAEAWENFSYPIKVKILSEYHRQMDGVLTLNLQDQKVQSIIQKRLNKTFESKQKLEDKSFIQLEKITLPNKVYKWDMLPPEEEVISDEEDSEIDS